MYNTAGLFTTIKCLVAGTYTFLPPHGKKMAVGDTLTVQGDITDGITRGDRRGSEAHLNGLVNAIGKRQLTIVSTPSVVLLDSQTGDSDILVLHSGSLTVYEPTWQSSYSPADKTNTIVHD